MGAVLLETLRPTVRTPSSMVVPDDTELERSERRADFASETDVGVMKESRSKLKGPTVQPARTTATASTATAPSMRSTLPDFISTSSLPSDSRRLTQLTWYLTPHSRTGAFARNAVAPSLATLSPAKRYASQV